MADHPIRVLLVEDSIADALLVTQRLETELGSLSLIGLERVASLAEAVRRLSHHPADVVLLDLNLPDSAGAETVLRLRAAEPRVPILVYSASGEVDLPLRALRAGAQDFVGKGDLECGPLIDRIRGVIERTRLLEESQRRQTESEDARRMHSLGVLGAGAAFGFNQLIGAILDHTDEAISELAAGPRSSSTILHLHETRKAALRAIELAARLRDFARIDRAEPEHLHLSEFVGLELPQLEAIAGPGIELDCAVDTPDPAVLVNPIELRHILLNLVVNACEAIRPARGRIAITTSELWADDSLLAKGHGAPELHEGRYALLRVCDSGHGLDARCRDRIFDPFFTTKYAGRGMGLASALAAVRRQGGWIGADTDPVAHGARFQVLFPVAA